jgi:hypothetical protein
MTTNRETGDLAGFFRAQGICPGKIKYYTGWLDQFFQFYQGGTDYVSNKALIAFGHFLSKKGIEEWQILQAREAVFLYMDQTIPAVFPHQISAHGNARACQTVSHLSGRGKKGVYVHPEPGV